MRRLAYGSTVLAGQLVSTVTGHPSPSMHGSNAQALRLSATEQVVWEKEEAYWQFVRGENRQEYLNLWDDRFVGWPRFENNPIHKDNITGFMSERKVLDYRLEPLSVREFGGNVVITLYRATVHSRDSTGANESTRASRLTHTWMKTEKGWRIIGGMSADDITSALSPSPQIQAQTGQDRVLTIGKPEEVGMSEPVLKAASSLYSEAVARGDILGVVLLVARRGKVVLYEAMGVRDKEKNLPMEKDSPFQIKSMTKPMVASAALILADQGKLQLDASVSRYIPAFGTGRSKEIKVRYLMNHTSGFRIASDFIPKTNDLIAEGSTLQREVARLPEVGPAEQPGASYDYSNPGYNMLAAVIEVASGSTIERFLDRSLFQPLGMTSTYAYWRGQPRKGLPPVYEKKNGSWEIAQELEAPFATGSSSLVSTAWDYAKFCQMFLDHGIYNGLPVISESSVKEATSITVRNALLYPTTQQLQQRQMQPRWYYRRDSRGLGIDVGYGLGWTIASDGTFSHAGSWETFAWVDPNREIVGIILTQNVGGRNPGIEFINVVNSALRD